MGAVNHIVVTSHPVVKYYKYTVLAKTATSKPETKTATSKLATNRNNGV